MTRRAFLKSAALASAAVACHAGETPARRKGGTPSPQRKPNILYLMTDQHRSDCLGCMGNRVIKTPHLDSIASGGVVFSRAYSSTPSCTPARSAILTGLSPWHHGMIGYGRVAGQYPFELPQALRDAGYYVFGIGKMHWYPQRKLRGYHKILLDESGRAETKGFVSDYRLWFRQQTPDLNPDATGIGWNDYRTKTYALPERLHPTTWTADTAVDFIEKYDRTEPFMLKVSFARPHSPYDPPERFMNMYAEEDMPAPSVGDWAARHAPHKDPPNPSLWQGDLGVEQAKKSRRGYYASVTFIDEQIGRILVALKKRGLYENTLILFFADHGDMLGDHHLWRKTYAYESSARIPMLLRWPAGMGTDRQRGKTLSRPVELRDVLPTFLDAAGAPIPGHLDGKSLLELVRGNTQGWRPYIDLEHSMCYSKDHWNALTDGKFKYIYYAYDGREQLFDLTNDPNELHDLGTDPAYKNTLLQWRRQIVEHLSERGEPFVSGGKLTLRKKRMLYSPHYPGAASANL
ncbi:MAG: arylsulfatase [Planctomycetes bacterium RBG_16_55_9]|nr:MAG: arylsulfatase [Planctomycetes bacterium RBG_16_55_9]